MAPKTLIHFYRARCEMRQIVKHKRVRRCYTYTNIHEIELNPPKLSPQQVNTTNNPKSGAKNVAPQGEQFIPLVLILSEKSTQTLSE